MKIGSIAIGSHCSKWFMLPIYLRITKVGFVLWSPGKYLISLADPVKGDRI